MATPSSDFGITTPVVDGSVNNRFHFAFNDEKFSDRILYIVRATKSISTNPLWTNSIWTNSILKKTKVSLSQEKKILSLEEDDEDGSNPCTKHELQNLNIEKVHTNNKGEEKKEKKRKKKKKKQGQETKPKSEELKSDNAPKGNESKSDQAETNVDHPKKLNNEIKIPEPMFIRKIYVSSILLASASTVLKTMLTNGMHETNTNTMVIEVEDEEEAELLFCLIRFIYHGEFFHLAPDKILPLLLTADKFGIEDAIKNCFELLSSNLTMERCSNYLNFPESLLLNPKFEPLMLECIDFIAVTYEDFESKWLLNEFINLTEMAVIGVLSNNSLRVRVENTIYRAASHWWQKSPHSTINKLNFFSDCKDSNNNNNQNMQKIAQAATKLLFSVRFDLLSNDFLVDVVKHDILFIHAGLEAKQMYQNSIEIRTWSIFRKQLIAKSPKIRPESKDLIKNPIRPFYWTIENVSKMIPGSYIFSPSFYADGYYFRFQTGRIRWERPDGFAFAMFLSLDLEKSGLDTKRPFFIQSESKFLYRNVETKEYQFTEQNEGKDIFTNRSIELGYFDVFHTAWVDLIKPGSKYVGADDKLYLSLSFCLLV